MKRMDTRSYELITIAWFALLAVQSFVMAVRHEPGAQAVYIVGMMLMWRLPRD